MDNTLSLSDWLSQQPLLEEIRCNEDFSTYIPIEFIKVKLDYLSPTWSTQKFNHQFIEMPVFDKDGNKMGMTLWVSASIELIISYKIDIRSEEGKKFIPPTFNNVKRILSGATTFDVQKYYPNTSWAQTALSLSIVAAAKELGDFFGKSLNKERLTVPTVNPKQIKKENKLANTLKSLIS